MAQAYYWRPAISDDSQSQLQELPTQQQQAAEQLRGYYLRSGDDDEVLIECSLNIMFSQSQLTQCTVELEPSYPL